jgi:membrane protease subunit HflC
MKQLLLALVVGIAGLVYASAYTVTEVEQVIITQLGKPVGGAVTDPGLHFKLPLIQKANRFDKRWLEWDGDADEMPTKEKTYIWVDTYARWRIAEPLKFLLSVQNERRAQSRLDDIIGSETRNVIAAYELKEVVRLTNRHLPVTLFDVDPTALETEAVAEGAGEGVPAPVAQTMDEQILMGRDKLTRTILEKAQKAMPDFGIELVDIQFQRVNYTKTVEEKVFQRMISERNRIAELYRSQGKGASALINGEMDRELKQIESEAYRKVQDIEGAADAKATAIYAEAHNLDPSLYRLLKSLEGYKKSIDEETWLFLSTDSDYFKPLGALGD